MKKSGKFELLGTILIIAGIFSCSSHTAAGVILLVSGSAIFLTGRFI